MTSEVDYIDADDLLAAGFAANAHRNPEGNALFLKDHFYTYADLLGKAEIIFDQLNQNRIPEIIGIYISESAWTYAAILAVSLCGAGYVPLNKKLPDQKLQTIIERCNLKLIISEERLNLSHTASEVIIDKNSARRRNIKVCAVQNIAYILFTSGTTGEAKGVPITKKNCSAFFEHYDQNFDFNSQDKFLQPYELSFDVSVFCMFAAWNCGACLYVVPDEGFKYLNSVQLIKEQGITVTSMVPTVLQYTEKYLDQLSLPTIRYSFFSGDKLFHHLAVKWQTAANNAVIYNCYGPTETTIVCTSYRWQKDLADKESINNIVPLGKAFDGMSHLLLTENEIVNEQSGELCFSGSQVFPSYLDNENEQCFFMHHGNRFYKTGDLVSVNHNGNLIFHGRKDTQVKINGYRVELAEIENVIFDRLKKNVVVVATNENNINTLIAFIEGTKMNLPELRQKLEPLLPTYMLPSVFNFIDIFPKNINGKIDRNQLKKWNNEQGNI